LSSDGGSPPVEKYRDAAARLNKCRRRSSMDFCVSGGEAKGGSGSDVDGTEAEVDKMEWSK